MTLVNTLGYKVKLKTCGGQQYTARFQDTPTADLIVRTLEHFKADVMAAAPEDPAEYIDPDYFDNLIQLAKLAEIVPPEDGRTVFHVVRVAGVDIGHVTIDPFSLWAVRE